MLRCLRRFMVPISWSLPMDPTRFDARARLLGADQSRRGLTQLLAGLALGGRVGTGSRTREATARQD